MNDNTNDAAIDRGMLELRLARAERTIQDLNEDLAMSAQTMAVLRAANMAAGSELRAMKAKRETGQITLAAIAAYLGASAFGAGVVGWQVAQWAFR